MSWEVEYTLRSPIPTACRVAGYPLLGLALEFDDSLRIRRLRHMVSYADDADPSAVVHESERLLSVFFRILEFMYCLPIEMQSVHAKPAATRRQAGATHTGLARATLDAVIAGTVRLPAEHTLAGLNPRVEGLLYMFNAARYVTDAEAIRLHYMIWESHDLPGSTGRTPPEARRLRFVRDFVSHGVKLDRNPDAVAYIESKLGAPIEAYNPAKTTHAKLIATERAASSLFIEAKLSEMLAPAPVQ